MCAPTHATAKFSVFVAGMYAGQTTNFGSLGGGFSLKVVVP